MIMSSSWLAKNAFCAECGDIVILTQAESKYEDYLWYCASRDCPRHSGTETGDTEIPNWIKE